MSLFMQDEELEELEGLEELKGLENFEPEPPEAAGLAKTGPDPRFSIAVRVLKQVNESINHVINLLESGKTQEAVSHLADLVTSKKGLERQIEDISGSRVMEGVFNGQAMVGSDGQIYSVPPNYASKSRLVEGDILKLTIRNDGSFVFKQIGPIERRRVIGCLAFDASAGGHAVICGDNTYKVLTASVTYFKAQPGDEAVILVPRSTPSVWAAVENIVKK